MNTTGFNVRMKSHDRRYPRRARTLRSSESGYALLMALFMIVTMIIASQVVLRNLVTQGRREREAEIIWRGEQVERAIRLYYHKTGHYPKNFDDLEKGLPDLYFLRHTAYKDPMGGEDGSWRLIYINAAGQIIGSVRYATLQQMALMDMNGGKMPNAQQAGQIGVPVSSMSSGASDSGTQNQQGTQQGGNAPSQTSGTPPANGPELGQNPSAVQTPAIGTPTQGLADLKPTGPVDGPVIGGFLAGVVSKSERASIKVYKGGKKYSEWEFIWNPLEDQAQAIQQGLTPQAPQPGQPIGSAGMGSNPFGNPGGAIINPAAPNQPPNQ